MKRRQQRRSSYITTRALSLGKGRAVRIWGYDLDQKFVCRLEISSAGIAVFSGEKGGKCLCNDNWEAFVRKLSRED